MDVKRLRHMSVHTCGKTPADILFKGIGGQSKDGNASGLGMGAFPDFNRGSQAVHNRHLQIHENEIVGSRLGGEKAFQRFPAIYGAVGFYIPHM